MCSKNTCSSFNGFIPEIPDILVDNFQSDYVPRAYFLSHCHTDHVTGMCGREGDNLLQELMNLHPPTYIYMSEASAVIIENGGISNVPFEITEYIRTLDLGNNLIHLPENKLKGIEEKHINVTVLPAGHCLGSVMFLFKTDITVLYTGDIRIGISDLSKLSKLHDKNNEVIPIDVVYVDATFYNSVYEEFPSRKDSVECVIDHIKEWTRQHYNHKVCLQFKANFGYEHLYNEIYDKLKFKVYVGDRKWKVYRQLSSVLGVTNEYDHDTIQICKSNKCNCREDSRYLQIYVTAMQWKFYHKNHEICKRVNPRRVEVCFSTHSSKSELDYFVNYLKPKKAVGFVSGRNIRLNVKKNCELAVRRRIVSPLKINSPAKKSERKIDRDVIKRVFQF